MANVTRLTVRRALEGRSGVGEATRDRIRALAREHGYRPNVAARATQSGRLGSIDLLLSHFSGGVSRIPHGLLDGVHGALSRHELRLTLSRVNDEKLADPDYMPRILREFMADGVIVGYAFHFPPRMLELIEQNRIPAVWFNAHLPRASVRPDDVAAGRIATEHLLEHGHRRVGFVSLAEGGHYSREAREAGYGEAMAAAGLTPRVDRLGARDIHVISEAGFADDERLPLAKAYLDRAERPTAVVAYSDSCANVINFAAAELGLKVPRDLSVVTIADRIVAAQGRATTTVNLCWQAIGDACVDMLVDRINDPTHNPESRVMPVRLEAGQSVSPFVADQS